jgi:RNA polymerase sigma-70 factor (ECF subfamily)
MEAYERYADAIFRYCIVHSANRDRAKDLTQQTFLNAWTSIAQGTDIANMRAFLYRIAHNLVIDTYRERTHESLDEQLEEGGQFPDESPPPPDPVVCENMRALVAQLEPAYRTAVLLRYVDELPVKEIAVVLGVSPMLASVRIHRSIAKLRALAKHSLNTYRV